jgi:hypothetical protein
MQDMLALAINKKEGISMKKRKEDKNIFISELLNDKIIELHWNNSTLVNQKKGKKGKKDDTDTK